MGLDADEDNPGPSADGEAAGGASALEDAQSLWHEWRGLAHGRLRLAALETRRAGESLVAMVAAGVMLAILLGGAWLGLLAAAALWLVGHGASAAGAVLLAVAVNGLAALCLCALIRHKSRHLKFPATLRSLQPAPRKRRKAGP
jgi:uncharacterized membrane protein YqjE